MKKFQAILVSVAFLSSLAIFAQSEETAKENMENSKEYSSMASGGGKIFVEGVGLYGFSAGDSDYNQDGAKDGDTADTVKEYKSTGSKGLGFGLNVGYEFVPNLNAVVGFQMISVKGREYKNASATASRVTQGEASYQHISLGLRPTIKAFGGSIYAGSGLLVTLPFTIKKTDEITGIGTAAGSTGKQVTEWEYNLGLGMYGELGYQYSINDNLVASIGIRANVSSTTDVDKTEVITTTGTLFGAENVKTTTYKESYSTTEANTHAANNTTAVTNALASAHSKASAQFEITLAVGYKM